jgi:S-adenosylmethionine uptake transporter
MRTAPASLVPAFVSASVGIALFSAMDAVMKGLTLALDSAYNAMFWRVLAGALLGGALFLIRQERLPSRTALRLHILRGSIASIMAVAFFWGIARVPLAEGIALSFIAPLLTLYLAAVLLGERVGKSAIIASLLGLAGVGVILWGRLGEGGDFGPDAAWGIASIFLSAVFYAYNLILQRQQAQVATPVEIAFFQSLIVLTLLGLAGVFVKGGSAALGFAPPFALTLPPAAQFPAILGAALLAIISLMLLSWAYARAEAQALVAVEYTAFIWAALFGWLVFDERVTWAVTVGALLIVAGCIVASRQRPEHVEAVAL